MTKFSKMGAFPKEAKKTVFEAYVSPDGTLSSPDYQSDQPDRYENVLWLYRDRGYGDVFLAWNNDENNRCIYFGTAGDEFNV